MKINSVPESESPSPSPKSEGKLSLTETTIPTLEELLAAPRIATNVPPFEIIVESEVARDKPSTKKSRKSDKKNYNNSDDESEDSEEDEEELEEEDFADSDSNVEEVFPCDCRYDRVVEENSANSQACGSQSNCINRVLFIECNAEDCPCGEKCQNQRFQRRQYANVKVFETKGKGFGLFTLEDLKPDTFIMEYIGEILSPRQMRQRAQARQRHFYFMTLQGNRVIDATRKGNISRFMNHSCNPNCATQKWIVNGRIRIGLFALKGIKAGTELTFDYKFVRFNDEAQRCLCGEPNCAGFIGTVKKTPSERIKSSKIEEYEEDEEEEDLFDIDKLSDNRLDHPDQVSLLIRDLLRTEDLERLRKILSILNNTVNPLCFRKFLNLHGLKTLSTILSEHVKDVGLVDLILEVLNKLPVSTRNPIEDAGLIVKLEKVKDNEEFSKSDLSITEKSSKLLEKWLSLETVFRIPKKNLVIAEGGEMKEKTTNQPEEMNNSVKQESTPKMPSISLIPDSFSSALQKKRTWTASVGDSKDTRRENERERERNFEGRDREWSQHREQRDRSSREIRRDSREDGELRSSSHQSSTSTMMILDPEWREASTPDGKKYYYHLLTRESRWTAPMISVKKTVAESRREDQMTSSARNFDRSSSANAGSTAVKNEEDVKLAAVIERAKSRYNQQQTVVIGSSNTPDSSIRSSSSASISSVSSSPSASSTMSDRLKAENQVREEVSSLVVKFLSFYQDAFKPEEFKEIARKLTHKIVEKEIESLHKSNGGGFDLTRHKRDKIKQYLTAYLKGKGVKIHSAHAEYSGKN